MGGIPSAPTISRRRYDILLVGVGVALVAAGFHFHRVTTLPPGLDPDAASNGLLALKWLRAGVFPTTIMDVTVPEPIIVWCQTLTTLIFGPSVLALRSVSVTATLLACVAGYALALEAGRNLRRTVRVAGAGLAGLALAVNPANSEIGRTGLRATLLPFFVALICLALLISLRTGRWRAFLGAGVVLGAAAYTYLAARFLPIAVGLFLVSAWFFRPDWRTRLRPVAAMLAVAGVVLVPQLVFFAHNPNAFFYRASSVTLTQNPVYAHSGVLGVVAQKVVSYGRALGVYWRGQYDQSGWPLLLPVPLAGFLLGVGVLFRRRREPALWLLSLMSVVMVLPDVFGGDRPNPHQLRVIGTFVPIHVISGLGLAAALAWLARRWPGALAPLAAGVAAVMATWGAVVWYGLAAPQLEASTYAWYARGEVAEAAFVNQSPKAVIMPLVEFSRPVVAYLTSATSRVASGLDTEGRAQWSAPDSVVMLWPEDPSRVRTESVSYVYDPAALVLIEGGHAYVMPPAVGNLNDTLPAGCTAQLLATPTGETAARYCQVPFTSLQFAAQVSPTLSADAVFGDRLALQGAWVPSTVLTPAHTLDVASYWLALAPGAANYQYFVQVLNDRQEKVGGEDLTPAYGAYSTDMWVPGELVPVQQLVRLPAALPAGRYWLAMGWYSPLTDRRVPVTNGASVGENRALLGPLKVPLSATAVLTDETPLSANFGGELRLLGYQAQLSPSRLTVALRLQALKRPDYDYTLFVHVENANGDLVAQQDAQPLDGQYPTGVWDSAETVVAQLAVALPGNLPAGAYQVWMGIYYWQTGERLAIDAPDAVVDNQRLRLMSFSR